MCSDSLIRVQNVAVSMGLDVCDSTYRGTSHTTTYVKLHIGSGSP
jgi:rRNA maturation endonuclease Nob1